MVTPKTLIIPFEGVSKPQQVSMDELKVTIKSTPKVIVKEPEYGMKVTTVQIVKFEGKAFEAKDIMT